MKDTRVAGLADGELSAKEAQLLAIDLTTGGPLQTELEQQREVKEALGALPQYSAPDFMATRIMGEIAARSNAPVKRGWRPAMTWSASVGAFLLSFGAAIGLWPQFANQTTTMLADSAQPRQMLPPGMLHEVSYDSQPWDEVAMPAGVEDPNLKGFLQFAKVAHEYRKLQHATQGTAPDMPEVMLAISNSPDAPVVYATDSSR